MNTTPRTINVPNLNQNAAIEQACVNTGAKVGAFVAAGLTGGITAGKGLLRGLLLGAQATIANGHVAPQTETPENATVVNTGTQVLQIGGPNS